MKEHLLTTFVRTKHVFKHRLKRLNAYDTVKIYVYELEKLGCNKGPLLWDLKQKGEIWYDNDGNFRAIKPGPIDPTLLDRTRKRVKVDVPLSSLHKWMRQQLMYVGIKTKQKLPVYFQAFLDYRKTDLDSFFSVDAFSSRVHTPIVNLKGDLRYSLTLHGSPIASLDVKQMQPTILGRVLYDCIGPNSFSTSISQGKDVYVIIQEAASLPTRKEAKQYFFRLIFGKPMTDIETFFKNGSDWVRWINDYKSKPESRNPHCEHTHTNLAWLLQFSEVQIMTEIWQKLKNRNIPFLSIHDEILCRENDIEKTKKIMSSVLIQHFHHFEINKYP